MKILRHLLRDSSRWLMIALTAAVVLTSSAPAGIQASRSTNYVCADNWLVIENRDGLFLMDPRWRNRREKGSDLCDKWSISAPTLTHKDRFLTANLEAADRSVVLAAEKSEASQWRLEFTTKVSPKRVDGIRIGPEGVRFRLICAEGELRGWYLSADPLNERDTERNEREPVLRRLRLTKDREFAVEFMHITKEHYDAH